jgi:predicted nucleic acid-binding protein
MRIALDTNILIRANAKAKGPARELLLLIVNSPEHVLLLSPFLRKSLNAFSNTTAFEPQQS